VTTQPVPPDLDAHLAAGTAALEAATDLDALDRAEQAHLGRRSAIGEVQRSLGGLDADTRRQIGARLNAARATLKALAERRRAELEAARDDALLEAGRIDVTLPGRVPPRGAAHPLARTIDEVTDIFVGLGYRIAEGPEVETDWHNFQALNIPPDHPARSMQDTLYVTEPDGEVGRLVLRTHTSPVQVRSMLAGPPPLFVAVPGRVYRADTPDATHLPVFHQVELLAVDEGLTMGDLKGTMDHMVRALFGEGMKTRLRPNFFPFTEPSAEMDMVCYVCRGESVGDPDRPCRTCSSEGWIELGGCGMVNPKVLSACGVDPEKYSGFAFGFGIERMLMFRHNVEDMRDMVEGDVRFTRPFGMEI
jgi:phenylalanyl-tRNA synthetase alpha chain